jgi:1-acyl-sn-glycerol-3-phosphate acyltransferase
VSAADLPASSTEHPPTRGATIEIAFGRAWQTTHEAWPRTREHVAAMSVLLRGHMLSELDSALSQPRRSKPWPLPAGQSEDDPDTGLVEH